MNSYDRYKPTRLYVKEHTLTGLKYFGKSQKKDLVKYQGSGRHWIKHIEKYGREHIVNLWISDWFTDSKDIEEFALLFSKLHDIVESKEWANLKEENGLDTGGNFSESSKKKRGETLRKTKSTKEYKETTAKEAARKSSEIQKSKEFKLKHHKECVHCGLMVSPGNYKRWHGENCKKILGEDKWKEKIKLAKDKEKKTKSDLGWKENVWDPAMKRLKDIKSTKEWKETKGKEAGRKISAIKNTKEWKETKGKEATRKKKETKSAPGWKETTGAEAARKQKITKANKKLNKLSKNKNDYT
jgi:hypothetical protein